MLHYYFVFALLYQVAAAQQRADTATAAEAEARAACGAWRAEAEVLRQQLKESMAATAAAAETRRAANAMIAAECKARSEVEQQVRVPR